MKILITGGAGFQGSHLAEYLIKKGYEIVILNTLSPEAQKNYQYLSKSLKFTPEIVWNSVTNKSVVNKLVKNKDLVIHLAAKINVDESLKATKKFYDINLYGTYNILEAANKNNVEVMHISTCEIYGETPPSEKNKGISETNTFQPHSPYAASKAAADNLCYSYFKSYGLPVIIVRPFNIYGERQKENAYGAVIPIFTKVAMEGHDLRIDGDGEQTRDYLYITDLLRGYDLILANKEKLWGQAINLASGRAISINAIAKIIANRFNVDIKHRADRPGQVRDFTGNIKKDQTIGFSPKVSFEAGLNLYLEWRTTMKEKNALVNF